VDRRGDGQSRSSTRRDGGSSRGSAGRNDGRWSRGSDRRDDRGWREAPRRDSHGGWPSFRHRPRYPTYYRYGYYHRHGYYFPRYYFDYESYPTHASIRVLANRPDAEVYVDGYYAGVVDDFDGIFQRLNVAPGRHQITLRLDGFVTWTAEVFANPYSTLNLRHEMMPGPSEPYYEGDDPSAGNGPGEYENPPEYDQPR
jgi:hypothetical protein